MIIQMREKDMLLKLSRTTCILIANRANILSFSTFQNHSRAILMCMLFMSVKVFVF